MENVEYIGSSIDRKSHRLHAFYVPRICSTLA
jgi:hypothetical protein